MQLVWQDPNGTKHREIVILENLSGSGAGLFMGVAVPDDTPVQLITNDLQLNGKISHCRFRENGYVVGLKLNADVSGKEFIPEHLLDVSLLDLD